jgi:hypothetical protein
MMQAVLPEQAWCCTMYDTLRHHAWQLQVLSLLHAIARLKQSPSRHNRIMPHYGSTQIKHDKVNHIRKPHQQFTERMMR